MIHASKSVLIIEDLINKHKSAREFGRVIGEDISDIVKWRQGVKKVSARATVKMARLFGVEPFNLRPDIYPEELTFVFKDKA